CCAKTLRVQHERPECADCAGYAEQFNDGSNLMSQYWSEVVRGLTPYVPGEQPKLADLIKLNTNENPYPPSPLVLEALRRESDGALRLYPDPNSDRLRQAIADYHHVAPASVFVGNGSDEVLAHALLALLKHAETVLL